MSNSKISALTSATTPLAGTETLPIVQSSTTKQVSVANLTAGRAVSAASLALTTTPLSVSSGGTGLTTLTAGYIPYGAGTGAFGSTGNLLWDTANNALQPSYLAVGTSYKAGYYAAINGDTWFGNTASVQIGKISNSAGWFDFNGSANVNGAQISASSAVRVLPGNAETARFFVSGGVSIGNTSDPGAGNLSVSGTIKTNGYTVATLPTGVTGARTYVTNALAPSFGATVVGGGAITVPVFYNGSNWIVG